MQEVNETGAKFMKRVGMDGRKWAEEFCKTTGFADVELAHAWFANAIMAGYDNGRVLNGDHMASLQEATK